MKHGSVLNVLPNVHKSYKLKGAEMKDFPDLKTLFTSPDICECEHCRSVYSPAAYLTDLLKFLSRRGSTTPGVSAKRNSFKRRPDIGELDLNCDNSLVPVQYTDIVCETLEDALAGSTTIVSGAIEPLLLEGIIHQNIFNEFKSKNLEVAPDALLTPGPIATEWFVRDKKHTYKIFKNGQLHVRTMKQTFSTAAECKAIPEYINYAAYDNQLKNAVHPFALPLTWPGKKAGPT